MGRWTQYDEDAYRLPAGMRRVGYDADTGRYIFKDSGGGVHQGAPGEEFGAIRYTGPTSLVREGSDDEGTASTSGEGQSTKKDKREQPRRRMTIGTAEVPSTPNFDGFLNTTPDFQSKGNVRPSGLATLLRRASTSAPTRRMREAFQRVRRRSEMATPPGLAEEEDWVNVTADSDSVRALAVPTTKAPATEATGRSNTQAGANLSRASTMKNLPTVPASQPQAIRDTKSSDTVAGKRASAARAFSQRRPATPSPAPAHPPSREPSNTNKSIRRANETPAASSRKGRASSKPASSPSPEIANPSATFETPVFNFWVSRSASRAEDEELAALLTQRRRAQRISRRMSMPS